MLEKGWKINVCAYHKNVICDLKCKYQEQMTDREKSIAFTYHNNNEVHHNGFLMYSECTMFTFKSTILLQFSLNWKERKKKSIEKLFLFNWLFWVFFLNRKNVFSRAYSANGPEALWYHNHRHRQTQHLPKSQIYS